MINKVKDAFKENLKDLSWMDDETRKLAESKADAISDMIGKWMQEFKSQHYSIFVLAIHYEILYPFCIYIVLPCLFFDSLADKC